MAASLGTRAAADGLGEAGVDDEPLAALQQLVGELHAELPDARAQARNVAARAPITSARQWSRPTSSSPRDMRAETSRLSRGGVRGSPRSAHAQRGHADFAFRESVLRTGTVPLADIHSRLDGSSGKSPVSPGSSYANSPCGSFRQRALGDGGSFRGGREGGGAARQYDRAELARLAAAAGVAPALGVRPSVQRGGAPVPCRPAGAPASAVRAAQEQAGSQLADGVSPAGFTSDVVRFAVALAENLDAAETARQGAPSTRSCYTCLSVLQDLIPLLGPLGPVRRRPLTPRALPAPCAFPRVHC